METLPLLLMLWVLASHALVLLWIAARSLLTRTTASDGPIDHVSPPRDHVYR